MAWTITDWTNGPDWSSLTNVNDFISAVRERQIALGQTPSPSLAVAGDDVQLASLWRGLQSWVEDNYQAFAVSHDAGVKRAATYYDGQAGWDVGYRTTVAPTTARRYRRDASSARGFSKTSRPC